MTEPTSRLIKAGELKFNPLEDHVMDDVLPAQWTGPHVGKRMVEAFKTLLEMPGGSISKKSGFWPGYAYTWEDLIAQQEQEESEKAQNQKKQNRVRVAPSLVQVTEMERALYWPAQFLWDAPMMMRAVNAVSFAQAVERDVEWVSRKRGGTPSDWQTANWDGCAFIARGLTADKVPVF